MKLYVLFLCMIIWIVMGIYYHKQKRKQKVIDVAMREIILLVFLIAYLVGNSGFILATDVLSLILAVLCGIAGVSMTIMITMPNMYKIFKINPDVKSKNYKEDIIIFMSLLIMYSIIFIS